MREHPAWNKEVEVHPARTGYIINCPTKNEKLEGLIYPDGISVTHDEVYYYSGDMILNELGNIYASLFILSNIARYFPDKWIWHIENQTPLALVVSEFLDKSAKRVATLAYSELSRCCYIT